MCVYVYIYIYTYTHTRTYPLSMMRRQSGMISVCRRKEITSESSIFTRAPITPGGDVGVGTGVSMHMCQDMANLTHGVHE